jgi:hypothetical protein
MPSGKEVMKRLLGTVIAALVLSHPAWALEPANELPFYDVDKHCKEEADIYGKDPTMLEVCLEEEQKSYNKLRKGWASLDKTVKSHCQKDQLGPAVSSSYYKLRICIEHELKEDEELRDFMFRR